MSPYRSAVSDSQSAKPTRQVGRPPSSRIAMLDAAGQVFDDAVAPGAVTMDDVAAAAGVGKGTLFRAFGDRDGLLDAVIDTRFEHVQLAVEGGAGRYAETVPAARRIAGFLTAVLRFKLRNRNLMLAREVATPATGMTSNRYRWMHGVVHGWAEQAGTRGFTATYTAHALLAMLQIDVIEAMLDGGATEAQLQRRLSRHVDALLPARA